MAFKAFIYNSNIARVRRGVNMHGWKIDFRSMKQYKQERRAVKFKFKFVS